MLSVRRKGAVLAGGIALAVLLTMGSCLAAPSPERILENCRAGYSGIRDYTADITVSARFPGQDLPDATATVYAKPPDKFHIESRRIVWLPKEALMLGSTLGRAGKEAKLFLVGTDTSGGDPVYCLKIMPRSAGGRRSSGAPGRILAWVNSANWTVEKSEVWTGQNLALTLRAQYAKTAGKFWLPSWVQCTVSSAAMGTSGPGTLTVTFSNYRVNSGLTDEFFATRKRQR